MTLDSVVTWFSDPMHLYILGCVAGQLVLGLPDSPFKTYSTNVLHGLFASPQVFANGAPSQAKESPVAETPKAPTATEVKAAVSQAVSTVYQTPGILDTK